MKNIKLLMLVFILSIGLVACANETTTTETDTEVVETTDEATTDEVVEEEVVDEEVTTDGDLVLTLDELAQYNGKDGQPAYVAVDGVIYDMTESSMWAEGEHNGFEAGTDLTAEIEEASPHGTSVLERMPVVGTLAD